MKQSPPLSSLIILLAIAKSVLAGPISYTYTTIAIPGPSTIAHGINDAGDIVGSFAAISNNGPETSNGFLLTSTGSVQTIEPDEFSTAYGINSSGEIVGSGSELLYPSELPGNPEGFLDNQGVFTNLIDPGGTFTDASGINASGQISGIGPGGAFIYSNGVFTPIAVPAGFTVVGAGAINDAGDVVGYGYTTGDGANEADYRGFIDVNGSVNLFSVSAQYGTAAFGINNSGAIVGTEFAAGSDNPQGGFLDVDGNITPIDVPGAGFTEAFGINDEGQIVGEFNGGNCPEFQCGFVATPISATPESGPFSLTGIGLIGLALLSRARKRSRATRDRTGCPA